MPLIKRIINSLKKVAIYARNFGVSAIVDVSIFTIVLYFIKPLLPAASSILISTATARIVSSLVNFNLNKALFTAKNTNHRSYLIRYYALWSSLIILSSSIVYLLNDVFALNEVVAKAIADMSLGLFSYQVQMRWVFREKSNLTKKGLYFRLVRKIFRLFLKRKIHIDEEIFTQANVLVGHHQNFYGPISSIAWLPDTVNVWVISHLFTFKECFDMYYNVTFRRTIKLPKILALIMSTFFALLLPPLLRSGRLIPVYRESRDITKTFKLSMDSLNKGEQLLVFPDIKYDDKSPIMGEVHSGFMHLEKLYYRSHKEHLGFVPINIDKTSGIIKNKATIHFSDDSSYDAEKDILIKEIIDAINSKD